MTIDTTNMNDEQRQAYEAFAKTMVKPTTDLAVVLNRIDKIEKDMVDFVMRNLKILNDDINNVKAVFNTLSEKIVNLSDKPEEPLVSTKTFSKTVRLSADKKRAYLKDTKSLRAEIRTLRLAANMTLEELGKQLGFPFHRSAKASNLENGISSDKTQLIKALEILKLLPSTDNVKNARKSLGLVFEKVSNG